jgi:hypothetical protein
MSETALTGHLSFQTGQDAASPKQTLNLLCSISIRIAALNCCNAVGTFVMDAAGKVLPDKRDLNRQPMGATG